VCAAGIVGERRYSMADDGDGTNGGDGGDESRLLRAFGVVIVVVILVQLAVLAIAATTAPSREGDTAPDAEWRLEDVNRTHVRIVHAGGNALPTDNLAVTTEGYRREVAWSARVLREGDTGVLRANSGQTVRMYWAGSDGTRDLVRQWTVGPGNGTTEPAG